MKIKHAILLSWALSVLLGGCSVTDDKDAGTDTAQVTFLLTDAPGDYQQVNIDIASVKIILNDSLMEMETQQGIYNILDFANGKDTVLVTDEVPSGTVSQVRLVLGENNSVMVDSIVHDLKTPSAQQSGLKLNVHQEFLPGEAYTFTIDFEAAKSVVRTGNGKYNLKPVIRVYAEAITGSVEGVVLPVEAEPAILAILGDDTASTSADTATGAFMIRGLAEGAWALEFHPLEGFSDTTLTGIEVFAGQTTTLDTLELQ
jgi:hypothetical protein